MLTDDVYHVKSTLATVRTVDLVKLFGLLVLLLTAKHRQKTLLGTTGRCLFRNVQLPTFYMRCEIGGFLRCGIRPLQVKRPLAVRRGEVKNPGREMPNLLEEFITLEN